MIGKLKIESQRAQIDVRTTNAKLAVTGANMRSKMRVKSMKAEMRVERQAPTFKQVRRMRLARSKNITVKRLNASEVSAHLRETMSRITGDMKGSNQVHALRNNISRIPAGTDPVIGIQAEGNPAPNSIEEISLHWDPGYVRTHWTRPSLLIDWDIPRPKIQVEPHSIEISLRRRAHVRISYIPPRKAAKRIDQKV